MTANTRILMIDDDEELSSMVADYLGRGGFAVTAIATAQSGLDAFRATNFDAVILDIMLPDGDGLDLCREIRQTSSVPVLMLTARGDDTDRIVGLELGADDYLPKPFNPRELQARLRAILRRGQLTDPRTDVLRHGDLVIDLGRRQVKLADEICDLTSHQFELLVALARNAGRVMSRESLMNEVRGDNLEAFDRSIDVHISRIRSAIEVDPKRPKRIITVRGAGYVFTRRNEP